VLIPFIAALTLAGSIALDVPYLPQTDALCGGAAMAMVYRYWGDTHAEVKQFASLVDRRAGGIADSVLVEAVRQRGWSAVRQDGSVEHLRTRLAARQPVIVLLADGRDGYHYVVVVGATPDRIIVHDPSWGPWRSIREADFLRVWRPANFWSLIVLPPSGSRPPGPSQDLMAEGERPQPAPSVAPRPATKCESLLADAVLSIEQRGLLSADALLASVRAQCPDSAGPLRELAGVRFAQRRWNDAAVLAHRAVLIDPADSYGWDVLGSSLFMQDDSSGALRAWNHIGRPRVNTVRIEGLRRTRYQLVAQALFIEPGEVLTAEAFDRSRRALNDLPDRTMARLDLRPEADGFVSVDVVLQERSVGPRGTAEWAGVLARTSVDREVTVALPGSTGQGEVWTASWRWGKERPRAAVSFAAPRGGRVPGVWRVDGSWEAQTYAIGGTNAEQPLRESRAHGSLTFGGWITGDLRYSFAGGIDSWNGARRDASFGASLEHRSFSDHLSLAVEGTRWIPLSDRHGFSSLAARVHVRASPDARGWDYAGVAGAERTSDSAPLALWSGAGDGRARPILLRAHPLLEGGLVYAGSRSSFGRTLMSGSAEAQRWVERPRLPRIGLAAFADIARASRSLDDDSSFNVDTGAGVRIRIPGWDGTFRVDVAHGLRDGRNAMTFGWLF
jgi:Papain-like cysteine protease AvrRpt2